ncbi:MAG: helix-turn-helix domain-containing protein [Pseudonocardiaceae bacterium]
MAEPTIGERIRELRRPTYTQHDLAVAADVSVDVIRKLEQNRRHTASIATLARIARALDVDIADLLGRPRPAPAAGEDQARVCAIRDALTDVDDLLGELDDADAPDLTELGRAVTYAWGLYWAGRYGPLSAMLPRLLAEAKAATHAAAAGDDLAVDLAGQVHQLTANALVRLGAADLGHTAAREALRLATAAPDPLRQATARCTLGSVLMAQSRFIDAERVAVATAQDVQPRGETSPAELSVFGGVLLLGATSAARQGRTGVATELLGDAAEAAERVGVDRVDYEVPFGPSNVVMQAADCSVVAEDYVGAANVARQMPRDSALPLAARSRHLVDVAHAQLRLGHAQAAESALLTMERSAPEWSAHHRLPRLLVGELMTRGRPSARLRELSHRLNVVGGRP